MTAPIRQPPGCGRISGADPHAAAACRSLWAAVILQAVLDAGGVWPPDQRCDRRVAALIRGRAARWLTGGGRHFRMVAALAGFDADFLLAALRDGRLAATRIAPLRAGPRVRR